MNQNKNQTDFGPNPFVLEACAAKKNDCFRKAV